MGTILLRRNNRCKKHMKRAMNGIFILVKSITLMNF